MAKITIAMAREVWPYHAEKSVVRKHAIRESSTKTATTRAKNPNRRIIKTKSEKSSVQKTPVVIASPRESMKFSAGSGRHPSDYPDRPHDPLLFQNSAHQEEC